MVKHLQTEDVSGVWEHSPVQLAKRTGCAGLVLDFLMYPQAEAVLQHVDCVDPDMFRYTITAREYRVNGRDG